MPTGYEFAPWIHAPESVEKSYAQGIGIAADVANQRAQLQQRQAEQQQDAALRAQQMAQEQQYRQGQLGISQQELVQQQQLNQLKIQDAQRRFAAQQQYQQDLQSGMDPLQAVMKNFPGTDESMTGYGQLARQMALQKRMFEAPKTIQITDPTTGKKVAYLQHPTESGYGYTPMRTPIDATARSMLLSQVSYLREQERELRRAQAKADQETLEQRALNTPEAERTDLQKQLVEQAKERQQQMQDLDSQIQALYAESGITAPSTGTSTSAPKTGAGFKVVNLEVVPDQGTTDVPSIGRMPGIAPPGGIPPEQFPPIQ